MGFLLKSESINSPEAVVFDRLLEWLRNDVDKREIHIPGLLGFIRLQNINFEVHNFLLKMTQRDYYINVIFLLVH